MPFPRVVFRGRGEGVLSDAGPRPDAYFDTQDSYFCLSFYRPHGDRDGLDAVSCASVLSHDKGRYLTAADVAAGYAEPFETAPGVGTLRPLSLTSAYPPRRDLTDVRRDHPDVARYASDALTAMPELDAITLATPSADVATELVFAIPDDWPAGEVTVSVEVNTEGDYGGPYSPSTFPTPSRPEGAWDSWAETYGYPYRGQPSVIFDRTLPLPDRSPGEPFVDTLRAPTRHGSLDASLDTFPIDDTIVDDPVGAPGSGADRLRVDASGARLRFELVRVDCRRE